MNLNGNISISPAEFEEYQELKKVSGKPIYNNNLEPKKTDLTAREREIFEFIARNEGISKQQIINEFNGKKHGEGYSYVTIRKTISALEKYDMIVPRKNPENKQMYELYVNNENILAKLHQEMSEVGYTFSQLLAKINNNYTFQEKLPKENLEEILSIEPDRVILWYFIYDLYGLCRYVLDVYLKYALVSMPSLTSDTFLLNKAHFILFSRLSELVNSLAKLHLERFQEPDMGSERILYASGGDAFLNIDLIRQLLKRAKVLQLEHEVTQVIDIVWKRGYDNYVPFFEKIPGHGVMGNVSSRYKNWRNLVENESRNKTKTKQTKQMNKATPKF
jgi:Fe2+ or Zn2+ uptake regulation protein